MITNYAYPLPSPTTTRSLAKHEIKHENAGRRAHREQQKRIQRTQRRQSSVSPSRLNIIVEEYPTHWPIASVSDSSVAGSDTSPESAKKSVDTFFDDSADSSDSEETGDGPRGSLDEERVIPKANQRMKWVVQKPLPNGGALHSHPCDGFEMERAIYAGMTGPFAVESIDESIPETIPEFEWMDELPVYSNANAIPSLDEGVAAYIDYLLEIAKAEVSYAEAVERYVETRPVFEHVVVANVTVEESPALEEATPAGDETSFTQGQRYLGAVMQAGLLARGRRKSSTPLAESETTSEHVCRIERKESIESVGSEDYEGDDSSVEIYPAGIAMVVKVVAAAA